MFALVLALANPAHAQSIEPYLLTQVWATLYDMDVQEQADPAGYGDPEDDIGFKVRRARLGFTGSYERMDYGVIVGLSAPADVIVGRDASEIGLVDAYAGYTFGDVDNMNTRVSLGVQKVPFGRENLMSIRQNAFEERTVTSTHIGDLREVGALADFQVSGLRVRAGVFNGNSSLYGDTDPAVMAAGRVEYSMGPGDTYETFGKVDGLTLGVAGDAFFNQQSSVRNLTYGGDVMLRVSGLSLMLEADLSKLTPVSTDTYEPVVQQDTMRWGGFAQVGYTVNMLEPMVRVEAFDDDTQSDDNGDIAIATMGLTGHMLEDHLRLGGGYVLRLERQGQSLPNDTVRLWSQVKF